MSDSIDNSVDVDKSMESYVRRYANDRDSISNIEDTITETIIGAESADDKYLDDYMRRYLNDNA